MIIDQLGMALHMGINDHRVDSRLRAMNACGKGSKHLHQFHAFALKELTIEKQETTLFLNKARHERVLGCVVKFVKIFTRSGT